MMSCIFNAFCTELFCDNSCPVLTETSYLLERNGITMASSVFTAAQKEINTAVDIITKAEGKFVVVPVIKTIDAANLLTYVAICKRWYGNQCHVNVYNLKMSGYIDMLRKSWGVKGLPEDLEYSQIWANGAQILIVSSIDFVSFKDYEAQVLLNLIHSRVDGDLTTIVVSPKLDNLIGSGMFFNRLKLLLEQAVIPWH